MFKILLIDDEPELLENLKNVLELDNYEVFSAGGGEEGILLFKDNIESIDTVITDMRMPGISGLDVVRNVKKIMPEMSVIVLTGDGDMNSAVSAMKEGAFDYLLKPVNIELLSKALKNSINKKELMVNNKRLKNDLLAKNRFLQNIHDSAQRILLNMVPGKLPAIEGFNFLSKYNSCDLVGGDMYDVINTENYVYFYVFDVSSHGILASVITVILKSYIQNIKYLYPDSVSSTDFKKIIFELNNLLHLNTSDKVFATMFLGVIDKHSLKFHYSSAGHTKQYLLNKSHVVSLNSTGTILGVFENMYFETEEIQLNKNDKILLFTDGVIETSRSDEIFGYDRLEELLKNSKSNTIDNIIDQILSEINSFTDTVQSDDTTILGIELLG